MSYERDDFKVSALLRASTPFIYISRESSGFELFKEYVLLAFNIAIELGQLLFIAIVTSILFVIRNSLKLDITKIRNLLAYFIGIFSSYWFIERVMAF